MSCTLIDTRNPLVQGCKSVYVLCKGKRLTGQHFITLVLVMVSLVMNGHFSHRGDLNAKGNTAEVSPTTRVRIKWQKEGGREI